MAYSLLPLALAATLAAHSGVPKTYDGARGDLAVATPSVADAGIRIDGHLNDPAWQHAAVLKSFTQYDPVEGMAASQKTQVLVLVDHDAIYFGIRAYDDHPDRIRATMAQRDGIGRSDDYVRIILDTFHDQRRAYVFAVNPLGVQQDGIWNEGGGHHHGDPIDHNPDFLWRSDGGIRSWGYEVEIRIPFKSLRFPAEKNQTWGLQVTRKIQRDGYSSSWAPMRSSISNKLAQMGRLTGLRSLDPGLFLELNPVMTGKRTGAYDDDLARYVTQDPRGSFGMNVTYGLTSNLTLDGTYNPDFSQVEADAGQISVNERFALYYPEKRPFFLEGTEIFSMPQRLVYTRSIANPIGGVKVTGKVGSWNLGYIGARDQALTSDGYDATVNLLRVRHDVGASSTVGMVYTDRTVSGDRYNRMGGADARIVFADRYTLTLLGAASRTADPDVAGPPEDGILYSARFERGGRGLSFRTQIEDSDQRFQAQSGFLRRTGDTHLQASVDYSHYNGPGSLVESWGPSLEAQGYWDHHAFWSGRGPNEAELQLGGDVSFRGNVSIFANLTRTSYDFGPAGYDELFVRAPSGDYVPFYPGQGPFDGLYAGGLHLFVSTFEKVRGNVRLGWSQVPIFGGSEAAIQRAESVSGSMSLQLYPTRSFQGEVGLRFSTIDRAADGSRYSTALIPRIKAQYQFSRAFFVRGIFEYSNQVRDALVDPSTDVALYSCSDGTCDELTASAGHGVHVEGLISYEASPGTVFYVGYTRQMEDSGSFLFRNLQPQADGLFAKVSYRFRM